MSIRFRSDRNKFELSYLVGQKRKRRLFDTKRDAREFLAGPKCDDDSMQIGHAIQFYFKNVSIKKSRTSIKNEKRYFNLMYHFLEEERSCSSLKAVTYADMVAMQNWFASDAVKWGPSTVNRAFNSIKDFFVFWVRAGERDSSPCQHLKALTINPSVRRPMRASEFLLAFEKADEWFKPAMAFMHLTASAPSSVARLLWSDVQFDQGILIVTRFKGKSGKARRIPFPINQELATLLDQQPRKAHGHVFSAEYGEPLSAEWCSRVGNRAIKRASIKGVVLYGIRHALASDLTDANVNMEIIRQLMGHSNIRTTQEYAKPRTESLSAALTLVRGGKCHQDATSDVSASPVEVLKVGVSN